LEGLNSIAGFQQEETLRNAILTAVSVETQRKGHTKYKPSSPFPYCPNVLHPQSSLTSEEHRPTPPIFVLWVFLPGYLQPRFQLLTTNPKIHRNPYHSCVSTVCRPSVSNLHTFLGDLALPVPVQPTVLDPIFAHWDRLYRRQL